MSDVIFSVTRRLQFCAGHRVFGHEGKCAHLHGHNYVVMIHARPTTEAYWDGGGSRTGLDSLGRVIDFSVLKEAFGGWIEKNWDHGFLFYDKDGPMDQFFKGPHGYDQKHFRMAANPTAENMAHFLLALAPTIVPLEIDVWRIDIWETENCYATAIVTDDQVVDQGSPGLTSDTGS